MRFALARPAHAARHSALLSAEEGPETAVRWADGRPGRPQRGGGRASLLSKAPRLAGIWARPAPGACIAAVGRGVTWLSGGCAACRGGWRPRKGLREEAEPDPVWEPVVVGWLLLTACPPFTVYGVELFLKVAGLGPVEYLSSGWNL